MKKFIILLFLGTVFFGNSQQLTLKKGIVMDSIAVKDSISESFSLYLPTSFEMDQNWPILFVFDMAGRGKQAIRMFKDAAEKQGYILAASNNVNDTLTTSQNILITGRMFNEIITLLPIQKDRTYSAGFDSGARFASVLPIFVKGITGVISCGTGYPNLEILDGNNLFHFVGIVGKEDYAYPEMLIGKSVLGRLKFPNHLLLFNGGHEWPPTQYLDKALEIFTLSAMAKGKIGKDEAYVDRAYAQNLQEINRLIRSNSLIQADNLLEEVMSVYRVFKDTDSLKKIKRDLKKDKVFKTMTRNENNTLLKESFIKEDYVYYLEEDLATYNYNNLGWWIYQMGELKKYDKSKIEAEREMGKRLLGYVNALIEDNIDIVRGGSQVNQEVLSLLWMLKTITDPYDYSYYLKIIASSAQMEDYGTSLFYLEELLKKGYADKAKLYSLEGTALLRITPEFNEIVAKYLKDARYDVIKE
ncbi:alpha/beta hydrolase [Arenibacter sp. BSSL-BM3]|uniref:Alpha/beta hydrolase n=1 Tax=Arenibacter arenosicollis TaxID=2762274 RepID=A0ABR7QM36_9FLAO|nr:alpha/beta hydrolase [Arenibacter arenosicollis]MBC8768017.1 alpha/beta hydrolase [Arenibacter arenosicollis]